MRSRRSASTPRRCWPNSDSMKPPWRAGTPTVWFDRREMHMTDDSPGVALAHFAATLRFDAIPGAVIARTQDLLLDWIGSSLAGKGARPVESIARFMLAQGPGDGPSEVLIHRRGSSPLVAAAINAAASHVAEQDDVHNGSVFHPAAVVLPPALAVTQALQRSGR